ncbi:uncharacterized protein LOC135114902 isoform X3 [Scylla paramamosain]|uniref:uncharacterized protein LOC135114902 isoform X3 n=1 Tax=Scylla paramamosain TaxID=85552 RepID=UPI003083D4FD
MNVSVSGSRMSEWTPSFRFGVPATCYLVTNVLYLLALRSTAPPLWLMLIQTRTFYAVGVYHVVFGRDVSWGQMTGCLLVVASLPLAHASELEEGRPALLPSTLMASQTAAFLSTMASIVIEVSCEKGHEVGIRNQEMVRLRYTGKVSACIARPPSVFLLQLLLKNDSRSFCEQQTWLYCWSGFMAAIGLALQAPPLALSRFNLQSPSTWCCVLAVVSSAVSGLCVPVIIRSLDTIVKDYLAALNNVLLALLTAALFPHHFTLSGLFLLSLLVLLCGIWLYERKTLPVSSALNRIKSWFSLVGW